MFFHLVVSIVCWIIGISFSSLSDTFMLAITIIGFLALLLFLKDILEYLNNQFLIQAEQAEQEIHQNLSTFKGNFLMIRDEDSPFSNDFSYLIFQNGETEFPLFCRNIRVIQKAIQANSELIIYYKDHILVDVEEVEESSNATF